MRHVKVKVTVNADERSIAEGEDRLYIKTTAPASDGKANTDICEMVQSYLQNKDGFAEDQLQVRIVSGHRKKNKILALSQAQN